VGVVELMVVEDRWKSNVSDGRGKEKNLSKKKEKKRKEGCYGR